MNAKHTINNLAEVSDIVARLRDNLNSVITEQTAAIRNLIAAFCADGHVLIEDFPGTGKTMPAKAFAKTIHADFKRIQFTSDLLPSAMAASSSPPSTSGRWQCPWWHIVSHWTPMPPLRGQAHKISSTIS
ncbi:MAG: AAA family ATPase [Nitrospirae bacterium]|nr:AAA family ATPase [Nitrospirota bacterium]